MNWLKNGNLAKLVAFFVIAIIMICAVALVASGWQDVPQDSNNSDADNQNNPDQNGDADENTNTNDTQDPPDDSEEPELPVIDPVPEFLHKITGLETDALTMSTRPICFVIDSAAPNYGISSSYLTVEIPTEDGKTRFLAFTDDADTLGKIGSIAPTRDYITRLILDFGGIPIALGNDDQFEYNLSNIDESLVLNLIDNPGYHYTEYSSFAYSNADLIKALIKNLNVSTSTSNSTIIPYLFNDYLSSPITFEDAVTSITISYSESNSTSFIYNSESGVFTLIKNGNEYKDLLNEKNAEYKNIFILSADSTTYETADATETVINTENGGTGVYITEGTRTSISWTRDQNGVLHFYNDKGELLTINRGTSYISFIKSSSSESVKYE